MTDKVDELLARLDAATSAPEVRALTAELKQALADRGSRPRLRLRRTKTSGEASADSGRRIGPDEVDHDAEAIKTWPSHLRARLGRSAYSRVIDGRPVDDPGAHGQRNDARRWSPWR